MRLIIIDVRISRLIIISRFGDIPQTRPSSFRRREREVTASGRRAY